MSGTKKIIYVVLIVISIGFAAYYFAQNSDQTATTGLEVVSTQDMSNLTAEITAELTKLNKIDLSRNRLDRDIFKNDIYLSLKDHTVKINDEPLGRINPFLPFITNFNQEVTPTKTPTPSPSPANRRTNN